MIVRNLQAVNFRNIRRATVDFAATFNLVVGDNAQGKTNLLEALHLFSLGRSFRTRRPDEMIAFGEDYFYLRMGCESDSGVAFELDYGLERGGKAGVSANKAKLRGISEMIGMIPSVIFSPSDVDLSGGPPATRRLFIDYTAAQASPAFLADLREYRRALGQRNTLLRGMQDAGSGRCRQGAGPAGADLLDAWDAVLAEKGAGVLRGRLEVLGAVAAEAGGLFAELAPGIGGLALSYNCSCAGVADRDPAEWSASAETVLRETLGRCRETDRRRGYTGAGPHCDDMTIRMGDADLRRFGSQGRKRLAAIVLKLAQAEVIMKKRAERPVVLLDDIFSELDASAAAGVRKLLTGRYQSFITSPRGSDFREGGGRVIGVENGVFSLRAPA